MTGAYTFTATADDGVRLWVDKQELFTGGWKNQGPTSYSNASPLQLVAGRKYAVTMEYYESTGGATAQLQWAYPGQARQVIPKARLYPQRAATPESGSGIGLRGFYFADNNFGGTPVLSRIDSTINFNWSNSGPTLPFPQEQDNFSVRWLGQIETQEAGLYAFRVQADDAFKLWINNTLVINQPEHTGQPTAGEVTLSGNTKHDIRVEFREGGGAAYARLEWRRPGTTLTEVVPQSQLYPSDASAGPGVNSAAELTPHFKLDESSGTTASDSSGRGVVGTVLGGTWNPTTGKKEGALMLSGSSGSRVDLPDDLIRGKGSSQSIALWFKTQSGGVLVGTQTSPAEGSPYNWAPLLYVASDGKLRGGFFTGTADNIASPGVVNDGQWHHAALVADAGAQTLYLDGVSVGTRQGNVIHQDNSKNQLGTGYTAAWPGGNNGWFHFGGSLDDVRFYSGALRATEVVTLAAG